jgi:N6-adenosine-specific RNA methylase IME4/ParB-like chromosome segregation protein Spo0J
MVEILEFPVDKATEANSKIQEIKINPVFRDLLEPLQKEEFKCLEQNIIAEGCKYPLEIWNGYIVDGHNRYNICKKHGIKFQVKQVELIDEKDATFWIRINQFGRRNLSEITRMNLALNLKDELIALAKETQGKRTDLIKKYEGYIKNISCERNQGQSETDSEKHKRNNKNKVNTKLAKLANVSPDKLFRYEAIKREGTLEDIAGIESGEKKIRPTYEDIRQRRRVETAKVKEFPKEKYRVVYADLYKRTDSSLGWEMKRRYEDIINIPIKDFLDGQAVVFLWSPINYLSRSLKVMNSWGFKYATMFISKYDNSFKGLYNSIDHYLLLVGTKNGCLPDVDLKPSSTLKEYQDDNHRNDYARTMVESLYPKGDKIEFFPEEYSNGNGFGWDHYQEQIT